MKKDTETMMNTSELALAVEYTVKATAAKKNIVVVFTQNENLASWDTGGQACFGQALINKADIASPARYDTIKRSNGSVWTVETEMESDECTSSVRVSSDQRMG